MVFQKGGPCGMLASFMLRCCIFKDSWDFRAYFGPSFVPSSEVWTLLGFMDMHFFETCTQVSIRI